MSDPAVLRVRVWEREAGSLWRRVGEIRTWTEVEAELMFLRAGPWSAKIPWGQQAALITPSRLVTFDLPQPDAGGWRRLMTGRVRHPQVGADEKGKVTLDVSGDDVLGGLAGVLIWPSPTADLRAQPETRYRLTGAATTLLRQVAQEQAITRMGMPFELGGITTGGAEIRLRERFSNLLEVMTAKAVTGGVGFRMGLVDEPGSDMRARLVLEFYVPEDRSRRVRLSHGMGTLCSWTHGRQAPSATRALLMGDGTGTARKFRQAIDTAAEAEWLWPSEVPVDSRSSEDEELTLQQQAAEALTELAAQESFELNAVEAKGVRLGQHFWVGDRVRVQLLTDVDQVETLQSVRMKAGSGGIAVELVPGNSDANRPMFRLEAIIKALRGQIRTLLREE